MTCPRCGSYNVTVSAVNDYDLKDKHHGCFWWLLIGWWWLPVKWLCFTIPALIIKIIVPKRQKLVTKQSTVCVCQDCGDRWTLHHPVNTSSNVANYNSYSDNYANNNYYNASTYSARPNNNIVYKMEDEVAQFENRIKNAKNPMAEYDAIEAYLDYMKVGLEYYYDISEATGQYFRMKYADSQTTMFYEDRFEELKQQLHK